MSNLALPVKVSNGLSRQDRNLKIAKREEMFLNAVVDLLCSQTSHPRPPALTGGVKP